MGRKILFVTTDQQRYDTLGCNGGTLARTPVVDALAAQGIRYERAHPAVGGVHAVAVDDPHRPAPEHARRVDERRAAPGRRAVGRRRAARRRLPHRARSASRTSSRSSTRSPASPRTRFGAATGPRTGPHRGFEHFESATHGAVGPLHYARWLAAEPPRGGRRCSTRCSTATWRSTPPAAATPARRRCTTTRPARVVPHRLGRRSHDRLARLARRRRRLVLLDELPRPAPPVGPAGRRSWAASTGATCRCPPATSSDAARARGDPRRQAAPLAALVRRHARLQLRGAAATGCRPRSPPTRCARSTPATRSSAS